MVATTVCSIRRPTATHSCRDILWMVESLDTVPWLPARSSPDILKFVAGLNESNLTALAFDPSTMKHQIIQIIFDSIRHGRRIAAQDQLLIAGSANGNGWVLPRFHLYVSATSRHSLAEVYFDTRILYRSISYDCVLQCEGRCRWHRNHSSRV